MSFNENGISRRTALYTLSGTAIGLGFSGLANAASRGEERHDFTVNPGKKSEWILRLKDDIAANQVSNLNTDEMSSLIDEKQGSVLERLGAMSGVSVERQFWLTNAVLVSTDDDQDTQKDELSALDGVEYVHPNFEVNRPNPVEIEKVSIQLADETTYGLEQVDVPAVWDVFGTRGEDVRVAVLDTGVDPDHPDIELVDDGWAEFDEEGSEIDTDPNDPDGHGTHVSGTVAGGDASGYHIGVAPDADLLHGKVLTADGSGTFAQIIAGMEWAVQSEADIINMSLGAIGFFPEFIEPVRTARDLGTVIITSSGNDGPQTSGSPANIYESVSVGATDSTLSVTDFSSGERIYVPDAWEESPEDWPTWYTVPAVTAPGDDVLSAVPGGGYERFSGTSMASPHVAGIAALAMAAEPELTPDDLEALLLEKAIHPIGDANVDTRYGSGIANAYRIVTRTQHDGTVSGTVTMPDGQAASGITVSTEYGTIDVTGPEGGYSVPLPEGETVIWAEAFGYDTPEQPVDVVADESVDLELSPTVDVEPLQLQRPDMAAGETIDVVVSVAHLDEWFIELGPDTDGIDPEDLSFDIDDQTFNPGESVTFDGITDTVELSITVDQDAEDSSSFQLVHEFSGPGSAITISTGPTDVFVDPEPPAFQITDPNFDDTVGPDRTLEFSPTIENDGELTDSQDVELTVEFDDETFVFPVPVTIPPGASETLEIPITFGDFPRGEGTQRIETDDDNAEGTFFYEDALLELVGVEVPETLDAGRTLPISVNAENVGDFERGVPLDFEFADVVVAQRTVGIPPGEGATIEESIETLGLTPDTYEYSIVAPETEDSDVTSVISGQITLETPEGPPPIVGDNQPQDLNGDGLYEDVDGDGELTIIDVQVLFNNLDSDLVQDHSQFFNFAGHDPDEVTITDVQALFNRVQET